MNCLPTPCLRLGVVVIGLGEIDEMRHMACRRFDAQPHVPAMNRRLRRRVSARAVSISALRYVMSASGYRADAWPASTR